MCKNIYVIDFKHYIREKMLPVTLVRLMLKKSAEVLTPKRLHKNRLAFHLT